MLLKARILEHASSLKDLIIDTRRYFHRFPELDYQVELTAGHINHIMKENDIPCRILPCGGVLAEIHGGKGGGPVCALRADMDALPVAEETEASYVSTFPGKMHACGHDAHMASVIGAGLIINFLKADFRGLVKLLFQPAEETTGGALSLIREGVLQNPQVDSVFGFHVTPDLPPGTLGVKNGKIRAASDMFDVTVRGASSHGAEPEKGVDAIAIASYLVSGLYQNLSRKISPLDQAVLSVGEIHGGRARNVLCEEVKFSGLLRSIDEKTRIFLKEEIVRMVELIPGAMGGEGVVKFIEGYPSMVNDVSMTDRVRGSFRGLFPEGNIKELEYPSMGVDDFAYFLQHVPGSYFMFGTGGPYPLHNSRFDIDEGQLSRISALLAAIALNFIQEE